MAIGVAFIAIGAAVLGASSGVLQVERTYSEECKDKLAAWNEGSTSPCILDFKTEGDGWDTQDVYVYYQLDNFYQVHGGKACTHGDARWRAENKHAQGFPVSIVFAGMHWRDAL